MEQGHINVQTENIFPIIKKFLYSDHEIFLRELVSNATDACQKLRKLSTLGKVKGDIGELQIDIKLDKEAKTITISDNGIGMSADEVKKYINQIAFSGATDFLDKYKDVEEGGQIIGHFGLGFYSAFMVAHTVEIITKSHTDEPAAHWTCDGSPNFTLKEDSKTNRGTDIILHIADDSEEFLEESRIQTLLDKYCKFLPVFIKFGTKDRQEEDGKDDEGKAKYKTVTEDNIINNPTPAWTKSPSDLKDEDYLSFYRELYPFAEEPLFWVHLNVDYPFNLTGILFFPKLKKTFEVQKNKIQLYSNQVFVTDNVEEIVPEFLMLLQGVIDSPDIPLNVSRSYLQSDGNVKKITKYISKKVADKLNDLFKNDRKSFEEKWESIGVFVKYGMLSDEKFYEKANTFCIYQNTNQDYATIEEYLEKIKVNQTDKNDKKVILYTTNEETQDSYIQAALDKGYDVLRFDTVIDSHFISQQEQKLENVSFARVDADSIDKLIEKDETQVSVLSDEEQKELEEILKENISDSSATIVLKALSPNDMPISITKPEFMRRMQEMQATGGGGAMFMGGDMPEMYNVTINTNHPLASKILKTKGKKAKEFIKQVYDIALLSQNMLKGKELTSFIKRSFEVIK